MSADFWSGYVSGAIGILVGNPLDIIKTKIQAGPPTTTAHTVPDVPSGVNHATTSSPPPRSLVTLTHWARGTAAPILGYGALNALLFVTYNRSLALLSPPPPADQGPPAAAAGGSSIWIAGALGGFATFLVSAPTELVKCRAQVSSPPLSSARVVQELWRAGGLRGLYLGGGITSVRDAVGYGFYFWSYEMSKRALTSQDDSANKQALKVLFCGGLAGVVTWASIFPLDVIKTRVQTWDLLLLSTSTSTSSTTTPLLQRQSASSNPTAPRPSTVSIALSAYQAEGAAVFFRGLGICSARAFIVNAVQWAVYEWMMKVLAPA